ncbi:hypothetical protein ACJJTC_006736 [Scirpophaga incertulas]
MLEYALKQERAKFHKLKYGVELQQGDVRSDPEPSIEPEPPIDTEPTERAQWKQGRQLIKQYLQEIGYADAILEVRSNRVRNLLGLNNEEQMDLYTNCDKQLRDRCEYSINSMVKKYDYGGKDQRKGIPPSGVYNEEGLSVQETAAVFANFEFLANQEIDVEEMDDLDAKQPHHVTGKQGEEVDHEAEEVLNELNMLTESEADSGGQGDDYPVVKYPGGSVSAATSAGETDEEPLALGELAQLTVSNEPEAYDVASSNKESFRKTWNAKYTLRSHFDGVRALAFHPTEAALVTASEDHTLKLWNLQRTVPAKKSASLEVEPLYTFRAHTGPVLCLAMGAPRSEECFSGGLDGTIRVWNLPPPTADPYDPYDPTVQGPVLAEHTDAVWSLAAAHGRLLSASADGTARLWAPRAPRPLLATLRDEARTAPPAAADLADAAARAAVVYADGALVLYDLETGQVRARPRPRLLHMLATLRDEARTAPPAAADLADAAARAAVVYADGALVLYDLETGQVRARPRPRLLHMLATLRDEARTAPPAAADLADAAARAAVVYADGALVLYDLETGQVRARPRPRLLHMLATLRDEARTAPPAAADLADAAARAGRCLTRTARLCKFYDRSEDRSTPRQKSTRRPLVLLRPGDRTGAGADCLAKVFV